MQIVYSVCAGIFTLKDVTTYSPMAPSGHGGVVIWLLPLSFTILQMKPPCHLFSFAKMTQTSQFGSTFVFCFGLLQDSPLRWILTPSFCSLLTAPLLRSAEGSRQKAKIWFSGSDLDFPQIGWEIRNFYSQINTIASSVTANWAFRLKGLQPSVQTRHL